VTGIPFFDPFHGQEGIAYNGIELHPILAIQFPLAPPAPLRQHCARLARRSGWGLTAPRICPTPTSVSPKMRAALQPHWQPNS
jgi:hypothetical protein